MADIIKYNSRITLKYDSIDNWAPVNEETKQRVWINFTPLKGEVCIINPTDNHGVVNGTCLFKVGNGTSTIGELPYLSALAADVHTWAKRDAAEFLDWATDKKGADGKTSLYSDSPKLATQAQIDSLGVQVSALETWRDSLKKVEDVTASGTAEVAVTSVTQADGKITVTKANLPTVSQVGTTTAGSLEFIDSIKQDKGKITATKRELPKASTSAYGVVKLDTDVPAKGTFDTHVTNYSAFKDDINSYRETSGAKRWKDAPNGNVIAEHYATNDRVDELEETIGNLSNVMNFRGVVTPSTGKDDPNSDSAALAAFVEADNNVPFSHGDVIVYGNKEYVYVVNGESGSFVEFGDTQAEEQRLSSLESSVSAILSYATVTGDSGETTASEVNDTLAIEGDDWIETTVATDKVTISHKDVACEEDTTATDTPEHNGTFTAVKSIDSDEKGHVTKVVTTTVTLPSVADIESDIADLQGRKAFAKVNSCEADEAADTLTIAGGTSITVTDDAANDKITIAHSDVTRDDPDIVKPAQLAHGGKIQVVTDVDSNDQGHVTAVTLTEFTLPNVSSIDSNVSDLQNHVWRTETTNVKAQAAAGAYTSTSELTSLAKSDLTIAKKSIGYIIWDCGSATENI